MEYIHHYDSPFGSIMMASNGVMLTGLWFEDQKFFADCLDAEHEYEELLIFDQVRRWLDIYFRGK